MMLRLVKSDNNNISDDCRKGIRIGKERLAGIVRDDYTEDELEGLLMAMKVVTIQLKVRLSKLKRERQHGIKPRVVK